ncbi:hypothetical protein THASP1DRAFT_29776 [Thamnocephalis sphaerospora]|uniref:F-box domain-containing protein n=1 Tax=Thamnocephalis sphaerospora TaxID=78915 RepID=A0A4P9XQU9_9FUNG|nr:hypothetical protein THASP1DRAFT_29776 [Thamnocephalis sphaerospora]|eukprot:RKP08418.1 hypothetical protein THASP1DRAFT_29776 [Thamnocephalis sphaerospora]
MEYIPEELFSRIFEALDETSLVVLSCVSKKCRVRISCRQAWWRKRFEQHFPHQDKWELEWLQQQMRANSIKAHASSASNKKAKTCNGMQPDWFAAYCMRRATEYRWRHGQYTTHRLTNAAITRPRGIRLRSSLLSPDGSSARSAMVVSQWVCLPQQQPAWVLERLCWGDIAVEHINVRDSWSGEHIIILGSHLHSDGSYTDLHSLYAWHSAALHKPPRVIVAGQFIMNISAQGTWILCQYAASKTSRQYTTYIYNLASGLCCSDSLAPVTSCRILSTTHNSAHIVQLYYSKRHFDSTIVTYTLWEAIPGRAASFNWKATGKVEMFKTKQSPVRTERIDDSRFLLWTDCEEGEDEVYAEIAPEETASLVLLQVANNAAGISLEEKWSSNIKVAKVWPIVSRNLLLVDYKDKSNVLLSLEGGTVVHRLSLPCWYYSHLYPLEAQWEAMAKHTMWKAPSVNQSKSSGLKTLTNAIIYGKSNSFTVIDYADYVPRRCQKTQLALEQQLASFIDVENLPADKRRMLFELFA